MRVLLAPHHFGNILTPDVVGDALARGWRSARPDDELIVHPLSNGTTGFLQAIPGETEVISVDSGTDPLPVQVKHRGEEGDRWHTAYANSNAFLPRTETTADQLRTVGSGPMATVLIEMLAKGARKIVLGTGRAPWHDAGAGMLLGLAQEFGLAHPEEPLREPDGHLRVDLVGLIEPVRQRLRDVSIVVGAAGDVPLRGLHGAGADLSEGGAVSPEAAQAIEALTSGFVNAVDAKFKEISSRSLLATGSDILLSRRNYHGGGGGVGYMLAALGAQVYPGAWVTAEETGVNETLQNVDLVVTGAGIVAGEELGDGVVADIASRASDLAIPVIVIGGQVDASMRQLFKVGIHASYPVIDTPSGRPQITAPPVTEDALERRGARLAKTWSR